MCDCVVRSGFLCTCVVLYNLLVRGGGWFGVWWCCLECGVVFVFLFVVCNGVWCVVLWRCGVV